MQKKGNNNQVDARQISRDRRHSHQGGIVKSSGHHENKQCSFFEQFVAHQLKFDKVFGEALQLWTAS